MFVIAIILSYNFSKTINMKAKLLILSFFILTFSFGQNILELNPTNFPVTQPCGFTDFNNKLFYVGANSTYGRELFSTDGTLVGNQLVRDIGNQYFAQTNGFMIQSSEVADGKFAKFNGKLYFEANNEFQQNNFKLWSTDGTSAGTQSIAPSLVYGSIRYFKEFNGRLYFTALGYDTGYEVFSTDGTTAGTSLLKDINPTGGSVNINNSGRDPHFTVFNNRLYFIANDGVHGNEIWSTDGTTAGTTMLKDINIGIAGDPNASSFFVGLNNELYQPFVVFNNRMYFNAFNQYAFGLTADALYSTDGTAAGTVQFQIPMPPNPTNSFLENFIYKVTGLTVANNKLYVFGKSSKESTGGGILYGQGIYQTDGTSSNTTLLKPFNNMSGINGYSEDELRGSMREFNGEYYFLGSGLESSDRYELWKLNPISNVFTKIVSQPVAGFSNFETPLRRTELISQVFDNKLYFVQDGLNPGIYSTNGTAAGTTLAARSTMANSSTNIVASTQTITKFPDQLKTVGNSLYFSASFDSSPSSLWRITNPSLKVSENIFSKLKVFPNPTSSQINLSFQNNLEKANLKITSILGQTVLEKQNVSGTTLSLDVSGLSMGTYIIQVKDSNFISTSKFIKQ